MITNYIYIIKSTEFKLSTSICKTMISSFQGRASLDKDGSSLILKDLTTTDEGKYRCYIEVETRVENSTNTAELPEEQSVSMELTIYGMDTVRDLYLN